MGGTDHESPVWQYNWSALKATISESASGRVPSPTDSQFQGGAKSEHRSQPGCVPTPLSLPPNSKRCTFTGLTRIRAAATGKNGIPPHSRLVRAA
eukprot:1191068-Rhodomonas_salina.1